MKQINAKSKRGTEFIDAYWNSTLTTLTQCYKSHSWEKENAMWSCKRRMQEEKGYNFRILSYNTFQFTCAWMTNEGLRIETANNSYIIKNL